MAWCRKATSHNLSQHWPSSLLPYGVIVTRCKCELHYETSPWKMHLKCHLQLSSWKFTWNVICQLATILFRLQCVTQSPAVIIKCIYWNGRNAGLSKVPGHLAAKHPVHWVKLLSFTHWCDCGWAVVSVWAAESAASVVTVSLVTAADDPGCADDGGCGVMQGAASRRSEQNQYIILIHLKVFKLLVLQSGLSEGELRFQLPYQWYMIPKM